MNKTDKRIAELEKELAELKKKKSLKKHKQYIFIENTDIVMYENGNGEKYFDNFKKLFESIKKKMKNTYSFSIWYKNYKNYDNSEEVFKQWDINSFDENEILDIISQLNAHQILMSEICIANKKDEIIYQIYFKTPFLKKYDDIVFQRLAKDEKEYWKVVDEGKKWRLFK